jgi:hypothetical protein
MRKSRATSPGPPENFGRGDPLPGEPAAYESPPTEDIVCRGFGVEVLLSPSVLTIRSEEPPYLLQVPPDRVTHSRIGCPSGDLLLVLEVRLDVTGGPAWGHATVELPFPATAQDPLTRLRYALGHDPVPPPPEPIPSSPEPESHTRTFSRRVPPAVESPAREPAPVATTPVRDDGPAPHTLWIEPCSPADTSGAGEWLRLSPPAETQRLLRPARDELHP